jgi:hypothetical protein
LLFRHRYNPETHDVVAMCKKLEEVFEAKFKECPSGDEIIEVPPPPPTAGLLVQHPPSQVSPKLVVLPTVIGCNFKWDLGFARVCGVYNGKID